MNFNFRELLLLSLLLLVGWAVASGQNQPSANPALERLSLTLVENQSDFDKDNQWNEYRNYLRLSQPQSNFKLTAGLLNDGDNYILFHRVNDQGIDTTFARINMQASVRTSEPYLYVSTTELSLVGAPPATGTFNVGALSINQDVTISIQGAGFTVSPTVISPTDHNIDPTVPVTVTYNGNATSATATVTITSDAGTKTVEVTYVREYVTIGSIDFLNDYTRPNRRTSISVSSPWSKSGTLYLQTTGYAYLTSQSTLTFTMPTGYSNASITYVITMGPTIRNEYIAINNSAYQVAANTTYYIHLTGVSSGDQITLLGISYDGTSYYYSDSPDIASIIVYEGTVNPPSSAPRRAPQRMTAPAVAMAASVSYWDSENNAWGQETPLTTSKIFEPNDTIDLYDMGTIVDHFTVSTVTNDFSSFYTYHATLDADILIPEDGSVTTEFEASVDFNQATGNDYTTAAFTGVGNWEFYRYSIYNGETSGNTYCCYVVRDGYIRYYVPNNYSGTTVSVKVTTGIGSEGVGGVVVNGVLHSFTASGSSYTWNLPVGANGTIVITAPAGASYTADIAKVEISGMSTATMGAPARVMKPSSAAICNDIKAEASVNKQVK